MATAEIASSPINSRDLKTFLKEMIRAGLSVLIKGSPGTGKTEIVKQAAAEAPAECMVTFPGMDDPTDDKGLGAVDIENHRAEFLPFGNFERALNAIGRFVWFMDDFGTAAQLVQATKGQLVQGRELNGKRLPDGVTFIVATNDRTDRSAVSGIIEMFKGRMTIVELKPEYNHWIEDYVISDRMHSTISSLRLI
jgi:MoxR-like ATPase